MKEICVIRNGEMRGQRRKNLNCFDDTKRGEEATTAGCARRRMGAEEAGRKASALEHIIESARQQTACRRSMGYRKTEKESGWGPSGVCEWGWMVG